MVNNWCRGSLRVLTQDFKTLSMMRSTCISSVRCIASIEFIGLWIRLGDKLTKDVRNH